MSLPRITRRLATSLPLLAALVASLVSLPANAGEGSYNQVSLRAEVQQAVNNDTLNVVLYAEEQHSDPARLAETISQRINQAIEQARETDGVVVASGNRRSHPVYDDQHKAIIAWRERAELRLESKDIAALSALTGELLNELSLSSMQFSLSAEARQTTENALISEAIDAFRQRANLVSKHLGGSGYTIVRLDLQTQSAGPGYPRGAMLMRAEADSVTPSLEAGEASVSVQADGVIEVEY